MNARNRNSGGYRRQSGAGGRFRDAPMKYMVPKPTASIRRLRAAEHGQRAVFERRGAGVGVVSFPKLPEAVPGRGELNERASDWRWAPGTRRVLRKRQKLKRSHALKTDAGGCRGRTMARVRNLGAESGTGGRGRTIWWLLHLEVLEIDRITELACVWAIVHVRNAQTV